MKIRPAALAGSWYPADPQALATYLDRLFTIVPPPTAASGFPPLEKGGQGGLKPPGRLPENPPRPPLSKGGSTASHPVRAVLVPHAGYRFSGASAANTYNLLQNRCFQRVVIIGPSHHGGFHGLSIADVTHYRTPLGTIPLDMAVVGALRGHALVQAHPQAHQREHSIEIQLPLLQRLLPAGWQLVPILMSGMTNADYVTTAQQLQPFLDAHTLLVLSGDFTHYGPRYRYTPFAVDEQIAARLEQLDRGALAKIIARDPAGLAAYRQATGITACAFGPLMLMLHLLPEDARIRVVEYTTSGKLTGDYQNSVSYVGLAVTAPPLCGPDEAQRSPDEAQRNPGENRDEAQRSPDEAQRNPGENPGFRCASSGLQSMADRPEHLRLLHSLAVQTIRLAVQNAGKNLQFDIQGGQLPEEITRPAGVFVTLKRQGRLRGCIGHIYPQVPLFKAVMQNAVSAALKDRRFQPVQPDELADLQVEISVLTPPEPIASYQAFEPGRHGIILIKGNRRAVYLPEVATEQGWDREQTLTSLARKAGLPGDAWREGTDFQVFTTLKYRL